MAVGGEREAPLGSDLLLSSICNSSPTVAVTTFPLSRPILDKDCVAGSQPGLGTSYKLVTWPLGSPSPAADPSEEPGDVNSEAVHT